MSRVIAKRRESGASVSRQIEMKVFTRWINWKLEATKKIVVNIQHDLSSVAFIISLVEILSGKKIAKVYDDQLKRDKMYNFYMLFSLLAEEGIVMGDIETSAVVISLLDPIMELVWKLIRHYSINKELGADYFDDDLTSKKLLTWLNSKIEGLVLNNFSSDWNDGVAIGVLVHAVDARLCTGVRYWSVQDGTKNAHLAMETASRCLGVRQLLQPEEIVCNKVSERSVMVYVSQFIALLGSATKEGDDVVRNGLTNVDPARDSPLALTAWSIYQHVPAVNAAAQGAQELPGCLRVMKPVHFSVSFSKDIDTEEDDIIMEAKDPHGAVVAVHRNMSYQGVGMEFSFESEWPGVYEVTVRRMGSVGDDGVLGRRQVTLESESNVIVYGRGLSSAVAGHRGTFILDSRSEKQIGISIEGPSKAEIECSDLSNGTIKVEYFVDTVGLYELAITANDVYICNSPRLVSVLTLQETCDFRNIRVSGLVHENMLSFTIDARLAKSDCSCPDLDLFDDKGCIVSNVAVEEPEKHLYLCHPNYGTGGLYMIFAGFFDIQIEGFPHLVHVTSLDGTSEMNRRDEEPDMTHMQKKCMEMIGKDLVGEMEISVRQLCANSYEKTVSDTEVINSDNVSVTAQHPERGSNDDRDGAADRSYQWNDHKFGLSLRGLSLGGHPIECGREYSIVVDMSNSHHAGEFAISIEGPSNTNVQCTNDAEGRCVIKFYPSTPGQYEFSMTYGEEPLDGSPFVILVRDKPSSFSCLKTSPHFQIRSGSESKWQQTHSLSYLEPSPDTVDDQSYSCLRPGSSGLDATAFSSQPSHLPIKYSGSSLSASPCPYSRVSQSDDSSSSLTESVPTILSGVYLARLKRIMSPMKRTRDEPDSLPVEWSSGCSGDVQVNRLSRNYIHSLNLFYENMLSAFTNLIVLEILLAFTEDLNESVFSTFMTSKDSTIRHMDGVVSFVEDSDYRTKSDFIASYGNTTIFKDTPSRSVDVICGRCGPCSVECDNPAAVDYTSNHAFLGGYIDGTSHGSMCVAIDSSGRQQCGNTSRLSSDSNQMSLTVLECHQSIRVDVDSTSFSSNKDPPINQSRNASAEVIFDTSSQTWARQITGLISVYELTSAVLRANCLPEECCSEMDLSTTSLATRDQSSCIKETRGSTCRPCRLPRLRSCKQGRWRRHLLRMKRLRVTSSSESSLNYLSEVWNSCLSSKLSLYQQCRSHFSALKVHSTDYTNIQEEEAQLLGGIEWSGVELSITALCERAQERNGVQVHLSGVRAVSLHKGTNRRILTELVGEDVLRVTSCDFVSQLVFDEMAQIHRYTHRETEETSRVRLGHRDMQWHERTKGSDATRVNVNRSDAWAHPDSRGYCEDVPLSRRVVDCAEYGDMAACSKSSSSDARDISSAVETLVVAITDIAKGHAFLHPSKNNVRRVDDLLALLPRLITFGKEKKLNQINYLTDRLEYILLSSGNVARSNGTLNEIIDTIKSCIEMDEGGRGLGSSVNWNNKEGKGGNGSNMDGKGAKRADVSVLLGEVKEGLVGGVRAVGQSLEFGRMGSDNTFVVYTRCTMPGSLSISIEGPSKAKINVADRKVGMHVVCYRVSAPGIYTCYITYNSANIEYSPFKITVLEDRAIADARIFTTEANSDCPPRTVMLPMGRNIVFHLHKVSEGTSSCLLIDPRGICTHLSIEKKDHDGIVRAFISHPGYYTLEFLDSIGARISEPWTLNVTNACDGYSPSSVHCNVGIGNYDSEKSPRLWPDVIAYGEGLSLGKIEVRNVFYLIIRHEYDDVLARDPSLSVTIDGPSKVELSCTDDSMGYTFWYVPVVSGIYYISISYSGEHHVAGSPFKINVSS